MSSSFKNAVNVRAHRERAQPLAREKLGLLEKKKDYIKRARNFQSKEKRLKALRWKAENRNPDEFYHKMISSKTIGGVHWVSREKNYDEDTLLLLKRQDINYIRMHNQIQKKKLDKITGEHLHLLPLGEAEEKKHLVFVDSDNEGEQSFNSKREQGNLPVENEEDEEDSSQSDDETQEKLTRIEIAKLKALKERKKQLDEYVSRCDRAKKLEVVEKELQLHQHLNCGAKGKRTKIGKDKDGVPVYKWRAERRK